LRHRHVSPALTELLGFRSRSRIQSSE
jgi:hypothetical protein